jgi:uncharacterized protein (UPF0335 family)
MSHNTDHALQQLELMKHVVNHQIDQKIAQAQLKQKIEKMHEKAQKQAQSAQKKQQQAQKKSQGFKMKMPKGLMGMHGFKGGPSGAMQMGGM